MTDFHLLISTGSDKFFLKYSFSILKKIISFKNKIQAIIFNDILKILSNLYLFFILYLKKKLFINKYL